VKEKTNLPPNYLLIAIIIMAALYFIYPGECIFPNPWYWIGIFPFLVGIIINLIADNTFKKVDTTVKPYEESNILVTTGIFSKSRNPMYLGFVLILLGIAILLGKIMPFLVIPIFILVIHIVFIKREEEMLEEKFKDEWNEYKKKTRMWI
jgi:protein-S-isoprenylcysteine O-methyltransferase Ste14